MTIIKIRKDYVSDKAVLILSDGYVSFPVELAMSGYTYKHIIRKYISIIELEKPAWHAEDQSHRWIEDWAFISDRYDNRSGITATKEIAHEMGYTNLEKLALWPKETKDNRFVDWRPTRTDVWVYTNEDRSKAVLAELNENNEAVESAEKEHHKPKGPRKKFKKGVWRMTVIEDDLVMEC